MEEPTMKESANHTNNFPAENQSELEDIYLPYKLPQLRKHGKVNDTTLTTVPVLDFDGILVLQMLLELDFSHFTTNY
jgi:hypothetical protein